MCKRAWDRLGGRKQAVTQHRTQIQTFVYGKASVHMFVVQNYTRYLSSDPVSQLGDNYLSLLFFCPYLFSLPSLKWLSDFRKKNFSYVYLHVIIFSVSLALFILPQATRGVSEYIKNFYNHEQCSSNYRKVSCCSQSLSSSNYKTSSDKINK